MSNPFKRLLGLIPSNRQDVGEIVDTHADGVTVELSTGGLVRVMGEGTIGDRVFIQGGAVIGPAPALTGADIEI